jgi:hypothetical protein
MTQHRVWDTEIIYEIKVRGELDPDWSDWFDGFSITCKNAETWLVGTVADQAALYGILVKIGQLNLTLLSVKRLENPSEKRVWAKQITKEND